VDNNFAVNPDQLTEASGEYADSAADAYRIPADLNDKIGDPNTIAGDDQYGALFAGKIVPSLEGAAKLLTGVGDGINNTSKLILTTRDFYLKANDVATDQASNLANHTIKP
jgi:hypothetical protein